MNWPMLWPSARRGSVRQQDVGGRPAGSAPATGHGPHDGAEGTVATVSEETEEEEHLLGKPYCGRAASAGT
jgi:hypothetical protein